MVYSLGRKRGRDFGCIRSPMLIDFRVQSNTFHGVLYLLRCSYAFFALPRDEGFKARCLPFLFLTSRPFLCCRSSESGAHSAFQLVQGLLTLAPMREPQPIEAILCSSKLPSAAHKSTLNLLDAHLPSAHEDTGFSLDRISAQQMSNGPCSMAPVAGSLAAHHHGR